MQSIIAKNVARIWGPFDVPSGNVRQQKTVSRTRTAQPSHSFQFIFSCDIWVMCFFIHTLICRSLKKTRPFHHQKLLDRTHAQKGRWFPLEYVLPILDYLEKAGGIGAWEYASKITPALSNLEEDQVYEVNGATTAEEVIKYFNGALETNQGFRTAQTEILRHPKGYEKHGESLLLCFWHLRKGHHLWQHLGT